jgi:hypothetical protein
MHTISISLFRSIWSPTEFPLRRPSPLATTQHSPSKRSFRFESSSPSPRLPLPCGPYPYADEAPSPPLEIRFRAAVLDFSKVLEDPCFKSITVQQAPPGLLHLASNSAARSVHGRARSPSPTFTAWSLEPAEYSTSQTSSAPTASFESGFHVLCVLVFFFWGGGWVYVCVGGWVS